VKVRFSPLPVNFVKNVTDRAKESQERRPPNAELHGIRGDIRAVQRVPAVIQNASRV